MNLFFLSWKNLIAKPLSTIMTLLLMTLGVGTISMLFLLSDQFDQKLKDNVRRIGLVIGANGSPTQIILSSVYHIGDPTGNIPWEEVELFARNRTVELAIPLAYGDQYENYRALGTTPDYLKLFNARVSTGRMWEKPLEVVLGARVALEKQLSIGDTLYIGHGLEAHKDHGLLVVGILEENRSVVDQLVLMDLRTLPAVHGHGEEEGHDDADEDHDHDEGEEDHSDHDEGEEDHSDHDHEGEEYPIPDEITALLLKFKEGSEGQAIFMSGMANRNPLLKAALPAAEISKLNKQMGIGLNTLQIFALVIMIVSALSVFISLYNSLKARRYELALMRTMGASPRYLFFGILLEGLILAFMGFVLGTLISRIGLWTLSQAVTEQYHYTFSANFVLWKEEGLLLAVSLLLGCLAALLPAMEAYRTQISNTLSHA